MDINDILFRTGENRDQWYQSIAPPVYQTSNFRFPGISAMREIIADEFSHHAYTRGNNPTVEVLRSKLAALEHTEQSLVFSSGAAAIAAALLSVLGSGDHLVCVARPYGWTQKLIARWLTRFGVRHDFADLRDAGTLERYLQPDTKAVYLESPNSITFEMQDLEAISAICRARGITTLIDNSYASPIYCNPADHGIDLVIHSATKYLNGHSDVVAGVVCGSEARIRRIFDQEYMILGAVISPYEAALILRGLRTLPLRMERSDQTARLLAARLEDHPAVRQVIHPGLPSFPQYALAQRQLRGTGGLFSICLDTDDPAVCEAFADKLNRFAMAASWGGYESLVMPMCAFHTPGSQPGPSAYPVNLVRIYAGLEDADWLWEDLEQALSVIPVQSTR